MGTTTGMSEQACKQLYALYSISFERLRWLKPHSVRIFDVRRLPNPHRSGLDGIRALVDSPAFNRSVNYVVSMATSEPYGVYVYCAYGRHRSVLVVDEAAERISKRILPGCFVQVKHLELNISYRLEGTFLEPEPSEYVPTF